MKISLRQIIIASLFFTVGIVLLAIHLINPSLDYTKEAIFSFGLIVPVFIPPSLFAGNNTEISALILGFYGMLLFGLLANASNYYLLHITNSVGWNLIIQFVYGVLGLLIINIIAYGTEAQAPSKNEEETKEPSLLSEKT
jgi:uncharacterized membrane protein